MNVQLQVSLSTALAAITIASTYGLPIASLAAAKSATEIKFDKIEAKAAAESEAWNKKFGASKSKAEKDKLLKVCPDNARFIPQLAVLMQEAPKDPGGGKAALWILMSSESPEKTRQAIETLKKYHINSSYLDERIGTLWYTRNPQVKGLLTAYIQQRKDKAQTAKAKFALARFLLDQHSPNEALKLLEEVQRDGKGFPEYKNSPRTLSEAASAYIFETKNLAVGKRAPNIIGTDVYGKTFKLSDYAGKLIMLDFFGFW